MYSDRNDRVRWTPGGAKPEKKAGVRTGRESAERETKMETKDSR